MSRSIEQLQEDGIWPPQGLMPDPEESLRHQAIFTILKELPDPDYKKLIERSEDFTWFIPHERALGELFPFFKVQEEESKPGELTWAPHANVLYLSVLLEKASCDIVMAVVAHELAHLVLGHSLMGSKDYDANEKAAWDLIATWGYAKQAKAHERLSKWRASYEQYQVKKLIEKQNGG